MGLIPRRTWAALAVVGTTAVAAAFAGAGTAGAATSTLRVGCGDSAYTTISAAVGAAVSGDTIIVCRGTYPGGIVVDKELSIVGVDHPVINATGQNNGFQVLASGSRIRGFTVVDALGEGILVGLGATPVANVTIAGNTVTHNDRGNPTGGQITDSSYPQCNVNPATPNVPGDCGEAIHLVNAFNSTVVGNKVVDNSGGILLSDDVGATYGNLVAFNTVEGNAFDCGIPSPGICRRSSAAGSMTTSFVRTGLSTTVCSVRAGAFCSPRASPGTSRAFPASAVPSSTTSCRTTTSRVTG